MAKPKHRKPKRRWRFWRPIFRYYAGRAKARIAAAVIKTAGPKEIARASQDYDRDGTYIRPVIQPYPWHHYVAPEDLERYAASIGGLEFEFELFPEFNRVVDLEKAARDSAVEHFGLYIESQPLQWIEPLNDHARKIISQPIAY